MHNPTLQQDMFGRRVPVIITGLVIVSSILLLRLIQLEFQLAPEVVGYLESLRDSSYNQSVRIAAERGNIYDRDGQPLVVNTRQYRIGISPNLVANPRRVATQLAAALGRDELEIYEQITSDVPWVSLTDELADATTGQAIRELDLSAIQIESIPRRFYPQGALAGHVLGIVAGDVENLRGYYGVEGYYQSELAGRVRDREVSTIPFDLPLEDEPSDRGKDVVLTIDRDIQFLAESELLAAVAETGATRGNIIITNPRNGDILAMTNYPSFDPNFYFNVDDDFVLRNPAIGEQYEPGSVMKVLTIAAALQQEVITPEWAYNDQGRLELGGIVIENWDKNAHGSVNTTQILVESLNVGAATVSQAMGTEKFYNMMALFGIGSPTGVDLEGEEAGTLSIPGDPDWSESQLGTNAFGQGVAVTPLQMLTAISAIANDGLIMQPRIVLQIIDGTDVFTSQATGLRRPISTETAHLVRDMMVATVRDGLDGKASVPGYTVAGKTGTAEIPTPIGYEPDQWIMTFVGFLPADDPQVAVLIKLDRPTSGRWASEVVSPIFRRLAERLVILLEIPADEIRFALSAGGGSVEKIHR